MRYSKCCYTKRLKYYLTRENKYKLYIVLKYVSKYRKAERIKIINLTREDYYHIFPIIKRITARHNRICIALSYAISTINALHKM